ncbi:MAG TPA: glycosyl transferase [Xanthobacteraceae bacterium]|jgi:UDP-N-acetylmuramyl pentapeptide phosphotransferase/UDP-N-acetylglucosamine-1-phosphate transferase|nr:glycosyl transferase [Xanthobacteraceae bacterium]
MGLRDVAVIMLAGLAGAGLIVLMGPLFARYALARPNARSSHEAPTPQGGGVAVVLGGFMALAAIALLDPAARAPFAGLMPLAAAVMTLMVVGVADDIFSLAPLPRLALQAVAVGAAVATLPAELRALPVVPLAVERGVEIVAMLWFVNLVNFMDGIDWITVAETVPITAGLLILALLGAVPQTPALIASALLGAMLGFAPFNRPVAKLFLGDGGSLPIGLVLGWLLVQLAGNGHLAAALLLPLYYLADATITLLRRMARGERITQAHRSHFYQIATTGGFSVMGVVRRVFAANVVLVWLAVVTVLFDSIVFDAIALALGAVEVTLLLRAMARGPR